MIRSFRHKGLKRLYLDDDVRSLNADHVEKLRRILARLDIAKVPQELDLPGYRLHPLKGDLKGFWSVTVQANWRVVFRLEEGQVFDVDYIDYH
jgi:proteic killer suppression protein